MPELPVTALPLLELICVLVDLLALLEVALLVRCAGRELEDDDHGRAITGTAARAGRMLKRLFPLAAGEREERIT